MMNVNSLTNEDRERIEQLGDHFVDNRERDRPDSYYLSKLIYDMPLNFSSPDYREHNTNVLCYFYHHISTRLEGLTIPQFASKILKVIDFAESGQYSTSHGIVRSFCDSDTVRRYASEVLGVEIPTLAPKEDTSRAASASDHPVPAQTSTPTHGGASGGSSITAYSSPAASAESTVETRPAPARPRSPESSDAASDHPVPAQTSTPIHGGASGGSSIAAYSSPAASAESAVETRPESASHASRRRRSESNAETAVKPTETTSESLGSGFTSMLSSSRSRNNSSESKSL